MKGVIYNLVESVVRSERGDDHCVLRVVTS